MLSTRTLRGIKLFGFLSALIILSACAPAEEKSSSAESIPTPSYSEPSKMTELVGEFKSDWSTCFEGLQEETLTCMLGYTIKNPTDAPIELTYGEVYAQVDGKIFKAAGDQGGDGVSTLSQTWNPGEELKGATYFNLPAGRVIEKIFFANEPDLKMAEVEFYVNMTVESAG